MRFGWLIFGLCAVVTTSYAEETSLVFSHLDWELACDNTRTCRAAGYHESFGDNAVSVMLTRKAGPNTPVTGKFTMAGIGGYLEAETVASSQYQLTINNKRYDLAELDAETQVGRFSAEQVATLLVALRKDSVISISDGTTAWSLSDKGATAVLLKMDEFQGRLNTPGALVRKGQLSETIVLPSVPAPVVQSVPFVQKISVEEWLAAIDQSKLYYQIIDTIDSEDWCDMLTDNVETGNDEVATFIEAIEVNQINDTQMLVSADCWYAAYNRGVGYWIIDHQLNAEPVKVTLDATWHEGNAILHRFKGRGVGDCWSLADWTWNGEQFVLIREATTGMCRGFAGGAWELPTLVTDLR